MGRESSARRLVKLWAGLPALSIQAATVATVVHEKTLRASSNTPSTDFPKATKLRLEQQGEEPQWQLGLSPLMAESNISKASTTPGHIDQRICRRP